MKTPVVSSALSPEAENHDHYSLINSLIGWLDLAVD
jgi:hypothetical protein